MRRSRPLPLALAVALTACGGKETKHVAGEKKDLALQVAFADSSSIRLSEVSWFELELSVAGDAKTYALDFEPSARTLTWRISGQPEGQAPAIETTTGAVEATLTAYDINSQKLVAGGKVVGGHGGPIDLTGVPADGAVVLPILVSRLDGMTPLGVDLTTPRFLHSATAIGVAQLLVVGGAGGGTPDAPSGLVDLVEWIDRFQGEHCTATSAGAATGSCGAWGTVPPPRVNHVALRLADGFAPTCPHHDAILVGLGQDEAGTASSDLYLFDPAAFLAGNGGFTRISDSLALTARAAGVAIPTKDCRVVLAGGHGTGSLVPIAAAEVLRFTAGAASKGTNVTLPAATSFAMAFRLDNAPDEAVIAGGRDGANSPVTSGVALTESGDPIATCDLGTSCNGAAASMKCARAYPVAVRLPVGEVLAPTLVVGDGDTPCGAAGPTELFRAAATESQYMAFVTVTPTPTTVRWRGHTATALADGSALLVGGLASPAATIPEAGVERFTLDGQYNGASATAAGTFTSQGSLASARAFHAATAWGGLVWVVGGLENLTGPVVTGRVELYSPAF